MMKLLRWRKTQEAAHEEEEAEIFFREKHHHHHHHHDHVPHHLDHAHVEEPGTYDGVEYVEVGKNGLPSAISHQGCII